MLTPNQNWMHERDEKGTDTFCSTDLTDRQQLISDCWQKRNIEMNAFCELYVKNWMGQKSEDQDWLQDCKTALVNLVDSGTHVDAQNAQVALTMLHSKETRVGRFGPVVVHIGGTVVGDGFSPTEVSFRKLSFHAIDYGGTVRISDLVKKKIHTGEEFEMNQRTNLHLSDAVEWHCAGRTDRVPSNHRVGFLA